MGVRLILDASVAAKLFYEEVGQASALDLVRRGVEFSAPDLIFLEFASLSAKKVRRSEVRSLAATAAMASLSQVVADIRPAAPLATAAYELSVAYGFSVYDATYLALADDLRLAVVTADVRLVNRAIGAGLGHRVQALA